MTTTSRYPTGDTYSCVEMGDVLIVPISNMKGKDCPWSVELRQEARGAKGAIKRFRGLIPKSSRSNQKNEYQIALIDLQKEEGGMQEILELDQPCAVALCLQD